MPTVLPGERLEFAGTTRTGERQVVKLQRRIDAVWRTVDQTRTGPRGRYLLRGRVPHAARGRLRFRVVTPKVLRGNDSASRVRRFRVVTQNLVSTDELNIRKKGRSPIFSQGERLAIVRALRVVDEVFVEESLEQKRDYILEHNADILVMGDDWAGRFDEFRDICEVVYLPRTPAISTTAIIEHIADL